MLLHQHGSLLGLLILSRLNQEQLGAIWRFKLGGKYLSFPLPSFGFLLVFLQIASLSKNNSFTHPFFALLLFHLQITPLSLTLLPTPNIFYIGN